jgi:hypothetical protein
MLSVPDDFTYGPSPANHHRIKPAGDSQVARSIEYSSGQVGRYWKVRKVELLHSLGLNLDSTPLQGAA